MTNFFYISDLRSYGDITERHRIDTLQYWNHWRASREILMGFRTDYPTKYDSEAHDSTIILKFYVNLKPEGGETYCLKWHCRSFDLTDHFVWNFLLELYA